MELQHHRKLVVCIVKQGKARKMIKAARNAGLEGATVFKGKGTASEHGIGAALGLTYDPDREVILSAVDTSQVDAMMDVLIRTGKLKEKNTGIAFVVDLDACAGIAHLMGRGIHL